MSTTNCYSNFNDYIQYIVDNNDLDNFKSNYNVIGMLEHVTDNQGKLCLEYIKKLSPLTDQQITSYCKNNDTYGGGLKYNYGWITTSPNNFRY